MYIVVYGIGKQHICCDSIIWNMSVISLPDTWREVVKFSQIILLILILATAIHVENQILPTQISSTDNKFPFVHLLDITVWFGDYY